MKNVLLTKAYSRLGMKYIPIGGAVLNLGVEYGPDAVLNSDFVDKINKRNKVDIIRYKFSKPEKVGQKTYYSTIAKETNILAHKIFNKLQKKNYKYMVTVGGDHSMALASVLAVFKFYKNKKVGLIDFDSHGDIHLVKTSPTGNFHGMWLRPLLSKFDHKEIGLISNIRITSDNFLYIGNLLTEQEEERFIKESKIKVINSKQIVNKVKLIQNQISRFCNKFDVIHVTFDIDVFKTSIVSATGTPNPNGFDRAMVKKCIKPIVISKKLFSLDLVEVNPKKQGSKETVRVAQKVILDLLK